MSKKEVTKRSLHSYEVKRTPSRPKAQTYSAFQAIDGRHPWQDAVPEGYLLYPVRELKRGQVTYFNFNLAKEMGLIPEDHPHEMTPALVRALLQTFSIQIINEYDAIHRKHLSKRGVKRHKYMATRYLQLQHANKQGKTSGDGRSVWNGFVRHKGKVWDVSSRGTGVTALSPGAVEANRPLKTGVAEFGYGCGMADNDELLSSAMMSEIFHNQGVPTERMLTIIDLGKGVGIGVRAAPNLIRPAHLFLWLKQEKLEPLKRGTDFLIKRQIENGASGLWNFKTDAPDRYKRMLRAVTHDFAQFAATLERQYIFAWLDWDGDNVLASAGIIDYGSIRQFGLRHDQYRYDDVQRFSTNMNEQRGKARLTVQVFAQLVDYLLTGKRKPLRSFAQHPCLRQFDETFERHIRTLFLKQVGYDDEQAAYLMTKHAGRVECLYENFSYLERMKTKDKIRRVADGVNRPAVFKMRTVLREMAALVKAQDPTKAGEPVLTPEEMMTLMLSSHAKRRDSEITAQLRSRILAFQRAYVDVVRVARGEEQEANFFRGFVQRAAHENQAGRITGNSSEFLIEEILKARKKGLSPMDAQRAMDLFIRQQTPQAKRRKGQFQPLDLSSPTGQLYQTLLQTALEYEDEI